MTTLTCNTRQEAHASVPPRTRWALARLESLRSRVIRPSKPHLFGRFGPGLIAGAADNDPSGIALYAQAGAQAGWTIGWSMLLSFPLLAAVQEIAGRIGFASG